jgi:hypothetical protein
MSANHKQSQQRHDLGWNDALDKPERHPEGRAVAKRAEARRKFWKHWQDTELTKLTEEQRQKRMAEVVARRNG